MKTLYLSYLLIIALSVNSFAINAPSLTNPSNGATNQELTFYLNWSSIAGNEGYIYQLDTLSDFSSTNLITDTTATNVAYKNIANLFFGTTYYWRVKTLSTSGNSVWSSIYSFTTKNTVYITSPSNGANSQNISLYIDWTDIIGNNGYIYQIDTSLNLNSSVFEQGTTATNNSYISQSDLFFGTTYYWRACAKSVNDTSDWSSIWNFTTKNTVIATSPNNGATNQDTSLSLNWSDITGNSGYLYQIDTSVNFSSSLLQQGTTATNNSYISISNLLYGTTYYWRACAISNIDTSDWSNTVYFETSYQLTNAPSLISPSDGSLGIDFISADLEWSSIPDATNYEFQYSIDNTFNSGNNNGTVGGLSTTINNLNQATIYYWRVRGLNSSGYSPWSSIWEFTTDNNVGISYVNKKNHIKIFPNPTSGRLSIIGENIITVEVLNCNGQVIKSEKSNELNLELNHLSKGLYIIKVITVNGIVYERVIIE